MVAIQKRILEARVTTRAGVGNTYKGLYTEAVVERVLGSTPNKATVKIFGLGAGQRQFIEQPNMVLQILAGETIAGQIFIGDIGQSDVRVFRQGAEFVTEIKATDGKLKFRNTLFAQSFPAGTTRSAIVTNILSLMLAARGYVSPLLPERVYPASQSFCEPARLVLDELYAPDNGIWSIQDGVFQVLSPGEPLPGNAFFVSERTGMKGPPKKTKKGMEVTSNFISQARPGLGFVVQSTLLGTGTYKISKMTHDLNSLGTKWDTKLIGPQVA